jgi:hypothetical protein
MVYNDYNSSYEELCTKAGVRSLEDTRLHSLATEVYKSINHLSPPFMEEIFQLKQTPYNLRGTQKVNLPRRNTTTHGLHSISFLGPTIWNSLPEKIKQQPSLGKFKTSIKDWNPTRCKCAMCSHIT